jgi:hypothetical protein
MTTSKRWGMCMGKKRNWGDEDKRLRPEIEAGDVPRLHGSPGTCDRDLIQLRA